MKFRKFSTVSLCILALLIISPYNLYSEWTEVSTNGNVMPLDGIWGTSETNMYAISFERKAFKCTSDCNNEDSSGWEDISDIVLHTTPTAGEELHLYFPLGIWGIDENNVFIVGAKFNPLAVSTGFDAYRPFIEKYNGTEWVEILVPDDPDPDIITPNWFRSAWGTSGENMYFCGGIVANKGGADAEDSAVIWKYDGTSFTSEVSPSESAILDGSVYADLKLPQVQDIKGFELEDGEIELFAVGLEGLVLHKNTADSPDWEIMPLIVDDGDSDDTNDTITTDPHFFRLWGHAEPNTTAENIMAVGFDNFTMRAAIYQYKLWAEDSVKKWKPTNIPETRAGFIPSLWGVWGQKDTSGNYAYHAVGNEGASLYLKAPDGNPDNIDWQQMVTGVGSSFNQVWSDSASQTWTFSENETVRTMPWAYASCEDGKIYRFENEIKRSGVVAVPSTGYAPFTANFSDISVDTVIKWEWDFDSGENGKDLPAISATADIDYKMLITAPVGAEYNNIKFRVVDNGNKDGYLAPTHTIIDPVPPTAVLDGKISIAGIVEERFNGMVIYVKGGLGASLLPKVEYNGTEIVITVDQSVTTQKEIVEALIAHRFILSASAADENTVWNIISEDDGDDEPETVNEAAYTKFTGCSFKTIEIAIESGQIRQKRIAEYIRTIDLMVSDDPAKTDKVLSAVPDNELYLWTVGLETYSNEATLTGGSDNPRYYVNEDTSIEYYYMASHLYEETGTYTVSLKITRPDGIEPNVETETVIVNVIENKLDFVAAPAEAVNSVNAIFSYLGPALLVKDNNDTKIVKLQWDFGDTQLDTGSASVTDNPNSAITEYTGSTVSHHYKHQGKYDVKLTVTLKDGSKVSQTREDYIYVQSRDIGKNSWNGGAGCFINATVF